MPKRRIEESAAIQQARIDRGEDVIVGVNRYQLDEEPEIDVLDIDNTTVRNAQIARLQRIRDNRDEAQCRASLKALSESARSGQGNLLALAIRVVLRRLDGRPVEPSEEEALEALSEGGLEAPELDALAHYIVDRDR